MATPILNRGPVQVRKFDFVNKKYTNEQHTLPERDLLERELLSRYSSVDGRAVRRYMRDNGILLKDVFTAYGLPPAELNKTQVRAILANDNLKPFFGPTTEEGFRLGIQSIADKWEPIIGATVDVDSLQTEWYEMQNVREGTAATQDRSNEYTLRTVGQGAEIPVSTITVAQKSVQLTKKGRGIQWSDEAKAMPVSLIQMFLQVLGIRIGQSYYKMLADRLLNGYFDDNSDDPTVVNAATTSVYTGTVITTFNAKYQDLLRAKDKLEEDNGYPATDIMAHPNTLINFRTMLWGTTGVPVFEGGDIGGTLGVEIHRNTALAEEYVIFFNRQAALVRYVYQAFGTEDDRIVSQQLNATFATMIDQVVIGLADSRVVLDLVF